MPKVKKTLKLTVAWVKKHIIAPLRNPAVDVNEKLNELEKLLGQLTEKLETLPAKSLSEREVLRIFNITRDWSNPFSLDKKLIYPIPQALNAILEKIDYVTDCSPDNEAYTRCRLNNILVFAIAEEKCFAENQAATESTADIQSTSSSTLFPSRPSRLSTPLQQVAPVNLKFETELKCNVTFNNKPRILNGIADYTLWYDNNEKMGTNLVIVEAKRFGEASSADSQLFAYMGTVHQIRKNEERRNAVIYGIATDAREFRFFRIDNKAVLTSSDVLFWDRAGHKEQIISYLRYVIRAAIVMSPTTSPIKGERKEEVLSSFHNERSRSTFDFTLEDDDWTYSDEDSDDVMEDDEI